MEYLNRKLGFRYAEYEIGNLSDAYLALANLSKDDTFYMHNKKWAVISITEKTISFLIENKVTRYKMNTSKMEQLARDISGLITAGYHGVDTGCLLKRLAQDPVFKEPNMSWHDLSKRKFI